ncbi:MAG TPA: ABC transporter permease, partial [Cyclobacteriaceae bacterium]
MLKNYLKISFRNIFRHKGYSFINIFGLTVGLTTSIFIFLWVVDELSYDRFHANADNIYRVMINNTYPDGRIITHGATPVKLKDAMQTGVSEINLITQLSMDTELLIKHDVKSFNEQGIYADKTLFSVFSFSKIKGNP